MCVEEASVVGSHVLIVITEAELYTSSQPRNAVFNEVGQGNRR